MLTDVKSPFGRVVLISGPESLLAERAVAQWREAGQVASPGAEFVEVVGPEVDAGGLTEMVGGSLFATETLGVVHDVGGLAPDLHATVLELVATPTPELGLALVHGGGNKGKALIDKLKKAKIEILDCPTMKTWELPTFVEREVRRLGGRIEPRAGQLLVDSVGSNLRAVASAVSQLVADSDNGAVTEELIRRYFGGRAEVSSFAVADSALAGQAGRATEQLRWALSTGVAPVLLTSALASGLRGMGKLLSVRGGGYSDVDVAREVGVPPWKLKSMRQQARGWDQRGVAEALSAVAVADADVKGAADDADYALERCVLRIIASRRA